MGTMELLLLGVVGWSVLGVVGTAIARRMGDRQRTRRNALWLVGVWVAYGLALGGASLLQPGRVVAMGRDQCFGEMCFAVVGAEEIGRVPGAVVDAAAGAGRVLRVTVRVSHRGHGASADGRIRAYVVDGQGRRWDPVPGLSGNALTGRVAGGAAVLSQPVFQVAGDASGLELVFTHGLWQPRTLTIGDAESLGHRRTAVALGR